MYLCYKCVSSDTGFVSANWQIMMSMSNEHSVETSALSTIWKAATTVSRHAWLFQYVV